MLEKKQYLLRKIDLFGTYISDFFGESDSELNSLETYAVPEKRRISLERIFDAKPWGFKH
jgi:hypothetical protein